MPHIHEQIDFTVGAVIVFKGKVLLIDHKKFKRWMPVGGHVELDEDTDQALFREIEEECGIKASQLEIISHKGDFLANGVKALYSPAFIDIHDASDTTEHKHIGLTYFFKSTTDIVKLAEHEHDGIKWFTKDEIEDPQYKVSEAVKFYIKEALKRIST